MLGSIHGAVRCFQGFVQNYLPEVKSGTSQVRTCKGSSATASTDFDSSTNEAHTVLFFHLHLHSSREIIDCIASHRIFSRGIYDYDDSRKSNAMSSSRLRLITSPSPESH